ncbi:MAG: hypothetical protein RLZZ618_458 [Pseudomonadota bacterium]|jgi:lipase chaperone LimK
MNRARIALTAGAVAVLIAVGWAWQQSGTMDATTLPSSSQTLATLPRAASAASVRNIASLGGHIEDAARLFELGMAGDLVLDARTKTALDLVLAELGDNPSPEAWQRLERSLRAGLPRDAATHALALVHSTIEFNTASRADATIHPAPATLADMNALIERNRTLRQKYFDPAADSGIFGVADAHTRYLVDLQMLEADTKLSPADKERRLQALLQARSPEVAALDPTPSPGLKEMNEKIEVLRRGGATEAQILQLRQQYVGVEGAAALAEMESERQQWETRYATYAEQKKALLADTSQAVTPAALDALLQQHYNADELPAARAYDRMRHGH